MSKRQAVESALDDCSSNDQSCTLLRERNRYADRSLPDRMVNHDVGSPLEVGLDAMLPIGSSGSTQRHPFSSSIFGLPEDWTGLLSDQS